VVAPEANNYPLNILVEWYYQRVLTFTVSRRQAITDVVGSISLVLVCWSCLYCCRDWSVEGVFVFGFPLTLHQMLELSWLLLWFISWVCFWVFCMWLSIFLQASHAH
jgi:hypothetical protein